MQFPSQGSKRTDFAMVPTCQGTFWAGVSSSPELFFGPKEPFHEYVANPCAASSLSAPLCAGFNRGAGQRGCPCPRRLDGASGGRAKPYGGGAAAGGLVPPVPCHLAVRRVRHNARRRTARWHGTGGTSP